MKRKIIFKNYQKLLVLILILVATLILSFINGSSNVIEGLLYIKSPRDDKATESKHKNAARERSKGDGDLSKKEDDFVALDDEINNE